MTTIAPWYASGPYAWPRCRQQQRSARQSEKPAKRVPESRRHFGRRVNKALDDPKLQGALIQAMTGLRSRREAGFKSFDFATGRADLKQRRLANLERLPELVERFTERLEAVGGKVHFAKDAAAAREIIGQICWNAAGGQHRPVVTKVKSMATEEIELNPYLESLGMDVVETDLGERMVQLTHTHPSHIIAPAIHLTKEDAARVFGTEPTVEAIQAHARESLRQKFISAAVGISGANLAIAETGTIMLVTNEGNADLTVTLPPVHIALFGIDKIVASLDDAVAVLRMLPRSGTGQIMTSYVNWITGPSRSADIEQSLTIGVHGPREMHCVILDNGREKMRADPIFQDALTCIRCGACSNACPPFMAVSGHQFGHIYNGPIGLVLTPFHHGLDEADLPNTLCTQCNACQEICPVDIPLPRQILEHRRKGRKSLRKRARLARVPYRDMAPADGEGAGEPLTIFASCMVDRMQPESAVALQRIAEAAGYRVEFPKGQWCCGLIAANAGYEVVDLPDIANCCGFGGTFSLEWPRVADRLAQWKLDAITKTGCTVVASDNPGCLMHIAAAARRRGLNLRVAHVLELVAEHLATL